MTPTNDSRLSITRCLKTETSNSLREDVRVGLTATEKYLPPKYFYDRYGSELFERICLLPEYYPTRTELQILKGAAAQIAAICKPQTLFELGSGSALKATELLTQIDRSTTSELRYATIDISEAAVRENAQELLKNFDRLTVDSVIGDFTQDLKQLKRTGPTVVALLGGTVGNFLPQSRIELLNRVSDWMGPEDHLLLGTDLVKDITVLEAAYNDSAGVTAAFNLNVLNVINRELSADIDLSNFTHRAVFNPQEQWIEMRLRARNAAKYRIDRLNIEVEFQAGEEILTEVSAKFTPERLETELQSAGLQLIESFKDPSNYFAISLAKPI